jgi:hypothetical protein
MSTPEKYLRPDAKGRVCLGKLAENVVQFRVVEENGNIVLSPQVAIDKREHWLYKNEEALAAVHKGMQQSLAGETVRLDWKIFDDLEDDE